MARKRAKAPKEAKPRKRKVSILTSEGITYVDYKDVNLLRRFMSERATIRARRVTGNNARQQRQVARAIRVAREMALLPYAVRQVTQRGKGKRRDRDREVRAQGAVPQPTAPPPPPSPAGAPAEESAPAEEGASAEANTQAITVDTAPASKAEDPASATTEPDTRASEESE